MITENYKLKRWAQITEPPTEKTKRIWFGVYRGVRYEINWFKFSPTDHEDRWTHYIWLPIDQQLEPEMAEKFWLTPVERKMSSGKSYTSYDYYDSIVGNLEFHGGCTWYSKESGPDDPHRMVKIGCDYQHLWDMDQKYDVAYVQSEAQKTIDSLYEVCGGKIKIRSWGDGVYRYEHEFEDAKADPDGKG